MAGGEKKTIGWGHWLGATGMAGATGTFTLLAYMHSGFTSQHQFQEHKQGVHKGAVQEKRYKDAMDRINKRLDKQDEVLRRQERKLDTQNSKLNQILQRLPLPNR